MSKVKIEGNASGTGTLTISAPNTNTDRNLTLPDGAGEILTDATGLTSSSGLSATNLTSGTIPDARFPSALPAIDGSALTNLPGGGKLLQVVENTSSVTSTQTMGSSYADITGCTVTITPTASNSKILYYFFAGAWAFTSSNTQYLWGKVLRGSTTIRESDQFLGKRYSSGAEVITDSPAIAIGLDSPATTSATTYKFQAKSTGTGGTYIWKFHDGTTRTNNVIAIAMEIGA